MMNLQESRKVVADALASYLGGNMSFSEMIDALAGCAINTTGIAADARQAMKREYLQGGLRADNQDHAAFLLLAHHLKAAPVQTQATPIQPKTTSPTRHQATPTSLSPFAKAPPPPPPPPSPAAKAADLWKAAFADAAKRTPPV